MKSFWSPPRMWEGGECWILGGGPSMPKQFGVPDVIISKVETGQLPISVYSDYMKPLHDKNVIGVNVSFMLGDWVSVLYFCDRSFYRSYYKEINAFKNVKVTCVNQLDNKLLHYARNIKRMKRETQPGLSTVTNAIRWNHNSGSAAIDFAIHAGAKKIYLLGFDMQPNEEGRTHWHQGLPNYNKPTIGPAFKRFLKGFPAINQDAKRRGIEIINVNPDSAIDVFPKVKLTDILCLQKEHNG